MTETGPSESFKLAGSDIGEVEPVRQAKVVVFATGDELAKRDSAHLWHHCVPEFESYGVAALTKDSGAIFVERVLARDGLDILTVLVRDALEKADCVVVVGGASVGYPDLARKFCAARFLRTVRGKLSSKPVIALGLVEAQNHEKGSLVPLATRDWLLRRPIGAQAFGDGDIVSAIPF